MRWEDIGDQVCSVARTLSVIGDRWSMMILRDAFLGTRRFEDFHRQLGVSRHRLSDRLNKLVENDVLEKKAYQERPLRYEYRLTEKGIDLYQVMIAMVQWGDKWLSDDTGTPIEYVHKACGHKIKPQMACTECGEFIEARDVQPVVGPALKKAVATGGGIFAHIDVDASLEQKLPPVLLKPSKKVKPKK